ncbi:preprotein translocase subunit YajC [Campylobacter fetus]|uniref:Sec translocon accessory complex subunit YajC n=3 Tax=Campylobacter fetus TaxID=196 RepID=A0A5L4IFT9_CAMFE|nr:MULTISPECIES: preprotein translocase subunit YajC [Campylobacter]OCS22364.1 preprotein translocase subunit YajC [Campylobacter fetus subsp. venerealis cfvi97/532]OCS25927.1 preprotein translocase subunit YajC [Campylobacter fetus subsp. venerealis cfvB10]OCS29625.1 preprotein translocase subunit YajC [Campylobacter fetus subsp. venerealis LMG 6570 = CCUG 33900]OCS42357.1 preprotein translocase subunit YajC [Campylobacter fetus subsp. venerealis cfvi02/298]ABK82326.1 preprotein translocase, 
MPEIVSSLLPLIVLFAIFYFLVIRPQQKQQKEHRNMLSNLQKGDKIVTNGGLFCEVVKPEDDFIKVKLNDEVIVRIDRNFVAKKIDKIEKSDA